MRPGYRQDVTAFPLYSIDRLGKCEPDRNGEYPLNEDGKKFLSRFERKPALGLDPRVDSGSREENASRRKRQSLASCGHIKITPKTMMPGTRSGHHAVSVRNRRN